jgi:hypothetical protein
VDLPSRLPDPCGKKRESFPTTSGERRKLIAARCKQRYAKQGCDFEGDAKGNGGVASLYLAQSHE